MLSAKPPKANGFTLIELLIAVGIIGIVSAIGMPMLSQFAEDAAVSTQADVMLDTLNFTRSEAVKRNTRVTMCRSSNGASCAASTAGTDGDWRIGWIVFVDDLAGGTVGTVDTGETVLRVQSAFSGRGKLAGTSNVADFVSYVSNGQTRNLTGQAHAGNFYFCGNSATTKRRRIALTTGTGWVGSQILEAKPTCTAA